MLRIASLLGFCCCVCVGRHKPLLGLAAEGVDGTCHWFMHGPDRALLLDALHRAQNPVDCSNSRVLLLDEFNEQSGMGFSFLVLHALLLQAMSENRTLLSTSAFMRGHSWRWCDEGPQSHGCYFEPWSTCEDDPNLIADFLTGRRPPVQWDAPSFGKATLQHAVVRLSFAKDDRSLGIFALYARWMHCTPALGRSFWFGASWDVLLKFRPWVPFPFKQFLLTHFAFKVTYHFHRFFRRTFHK